MDFLAMSLTAVLTFTNATTDGFTRNDHKCAIENLIYEAVGEDRASVLRIKKELDGKGELSVNNKSVGMRLVMEVMLNRLDNGYRGAETFCNVVHHSKQFSWTSKDRSKRRAYKQEEYLAAAQVFYSYIYGGQSRLLPENTMHYLNKNTASDLSWYDKNKVVYSYKNHEYISF